MGEIGPEAKFSEKKEFWKRRISEYLTEYQHLAEDPKHFEKFIGEKEPIERGNELMSRHLSTGYNFATFDQFPINSKESLIFYGVYFQRIDHFAELLARMEQEDGIIGKDNVSFGIRATKLFGKWDDPETVPGKITMKDDGSEEDTRESVEGVVIFHLNPDAKERERKMQAARIGVFLRAEAPRIKGRYEVPDIRATATQELKEVFVTTDEDLLRMGIATANVFRFESGNMIALRQESRIKEEKWEAYDSLVNPKLYEYLTVAGVGP
ncbi:MAG: hypothetical protein ACC618_03245 [Patescibacteria group bacterium]